jgi:hypothetical protein
MGKVEFLINSKVVRKSKKVREMRCEVSHQGFDPFDYEMDSGSPSS